MKRYQRPCPAVLFGLLLGFAVGCGSPATTSFDPTPKFKMEEIGEMLKTAKTTQMKLPTKVADLPSVEPLVPQSAADLRSGEIVYFWGAGLSADPGASSKVIAHEKKVPSEGGWVLMQDGTVKQMKPDEFRLAPKAGK